MQEDITFCPWSAFMVKFLLSIFSLDADVYSFSCRMLYPGQIMMHIFVLGATLCKTEPGWPGFSIGLFQRSRWKGSSWWGPPAAPYRNNKDLNAGEQATTGECNLTKFLERKKQVLIICWHSLVLPLAHTTMGVAKLHRCQLLNGELWTKQSMDAQNAQTKLSLIWLCGNENDVTAIMSILRSQVCILVTVNTLYMAYDLDFVIQVLSGTCTWL